MPLIDEIGDAIARLSELGRANLGRQTDDEWIDAASENLIEDLEELRLLLSERLTKHQELSTGCAATRR